MTELHSAGRIVPFHFAEADAISRRPGNQPRITRESPSSRNVRLTAALQFDQARSRFQPDLEQACPRWCFSGPEIVPPPPRDRRYSWRSRLEALVHELPAPRTNTCI